MPKPNKNWSPSEIAIVKECLARMLNNDLFSQSERQSRFLEYIVEKTIAGEGSKIKQFAIGIDVFDRDESFDPAIDSIVRVEAGRLRSKLREYYSNPDCNDEVEIEMRKGKYIVDFEFRELSNPLNTLSQGKQNENDEQITLAVLAFTNASGDADQEYFADGISEDIITDLSKFTALSIISRQSSFSYKDASVSNKEISRQLGAGYILNGSVRKAGNKVRVSAQLVDMASEKQLWAERYDRNLDDIFSVQDDVTEKIVTALHLTFKNQTDPQQKSNSNRNLEAYDCVLRGAEYARLSTKQDLLQAQALFRRAISLDTDYAEAYARLSRIFVYQWISGQGQKGPEILDEALQLAKRSVELSPGSALPHASLGWVYHWLDENDKAMAEWRHAIELDPNQTDALNWLSLILAWSGQTQEATEKLDCARRLNPLEKYYFPEANIAFMDANYELAIDQYVKLIKQDSAFVPGHLFLAASYNILGQKEEAKLVVEKLLQINPGFEIGKTTKGRIKVTEVAKLFRENLLQLGLPLKD
jgi:adenylate cyclase